jgi:hypothetical protein
MLIEEAKIIKKGRRSKTVLLAMFILKSLLRTSPQSKIEIAQIS